jgi:hypothetical protein
MAYLLISPHHELARWMVFHNIEVEDILKEIQVYGMVFIKALVGMERVIKAHVMKHLWW